MIDLKFGAAGYFRIIKRDADTMSVTYDSGEFRNVITNTGLDWINNASPTNACVVGIGTTPELPTDTTLVQQIARSSSSGGATTTPFSATAPYYCGRRQIFRFAAGAAAGNLTEVGITTTTSNILWSRSLIKDSSGNPVTITVLSNEILDVTYEIRMFMMDSDVAGSFNILGSPYTYVMRAARLGSQAFSGFLEGGIVGARYTLSGYSGAMGPSTGIPSGTGAASSAAAVWQTYTPGTYYRDFICNFALNQGNVAGGIKSMYITGPTVGNTLAPEFQMEFTPNIPKDNTMTLGVRIRISWGRMP